MPLMEATFELCKKILKSPQRDSIKAVLSSLNSVSGADISTQKDRSQYGYLARQTNAQFLSYLLVDNNRNQLEQLMPVPKINDDEKSMLDNAHQQLLALNTTCLESLKIFPTEYSIAANPYSGFQYDLTPKQVAQPYLSKDEINDISK